MGEDARNWALYRADCAAGQKQQPFETEKASSISGCITGVIENQMENQMDNGLESNVKGLG